MIGSVVLGMCSNNFGISCQGGGLEYTLNVAGGLPWAYTSAAGVVGGIVATGLFVNTVV